MKTGAYYCDEHRKSIVLYANDKLENLKIIDLKNRTIEDFIFSSIDTKQNTYTIDDDIYHYSVNGTSNFFIYNNIIKIISDMQTLKEYADDNINLLKAQELLFKLHPELCI